MRILTEKDVYDLLSMKDCIEVVEKAMIASASDKARQPPRQVYKLLGNGSAFGVMPGDLTEPAVFGAKIVSVFERAPESPHQSHQGLVILFDYDTGFPIAAIDGGAITGARTAAASAVATRALARSDARNLAIIGTGHQAAAHIEAMLLVRAFDTIQVWGRARERAEGFAAAQAQRHDVGVRAADTVDEAVADADVICTVTSSPDPVLFGHQLRPGVHVNAVGSSVAAARELDEDAVAKSRLFVDLKKSVLTQGGEFLKAKEAGVVDDDHILAEIGAVVSGAAPGRTAEDDITLYKSLGIIVQDLAAGKLVLDRAGAQDAGVTTPMEATKH